jgi:hypothetical protein
MSIEDRLRQIVTALPEQASVTLAVLLVKEWLEVEVLCRLRSDPSQPPAGAADTESGWVRGAQRSERVCKLSADALACL